MSIIAVFGDLLYDCFIWAPRLPREGETVTGTASGFFASGKGGNQAATCARLGAEALMLGKVGSDERGAFLLQTMRENGVNTEGVIVSPDQATGTDCVLVAADGKMQSSSRRMQTRALPPKRWMRCARILSARRLRCSSCKSMRTR